MSEIKKGDLVMIVKPLECCGVTDMVGDVFRVQEVAKIQTTCPHCGHISRGLVRAIPTHRVSAHFIPRLKKIDPPSTGEYDRVPVRMKEPA